MTPKTRCQGTGQWLESHHEATITWGQIAKTTGWKARYFCRKNRLKFFSETQDVGHIQKKIFWMIWVSFHYTFMFEIWLQGRTPWNLLAKPKRVGKWIIIYLYYPYQKKKVQWLWIYSHTAICQNARPCIDPSSLPQDVFRLHLLQSATNLSIIYI